jgi:hypothetical protein
MIVLPQEPGNLLQILPSPTLRFQSARMEVSQLQPRLTLLCEMTDPGRVRKAYKSY